MPTHYLNLIEKGTHRDETVATTLMEQNGGTIRRTIRIKMLDCRLQREFGNSDIFHLSTKR